MNPHHMSDWLFVAPVSDATTRLWQQVFDVLQTQAGVHIRTMSLQAWRPQHLAGVSGVLCSRLYPPSGLHRLLRACKRRRLPIITLVDDNYYLLRVGPPLYDTPQPTDDTLAAWTQLLQASARVVVCQPLLAEYLLPMNPNIVCVPPFFDFQAHPDTSLRPGIFGKQCVTLGPAMAAAPPPSVPVRIGWLSSPLRPEDYAPLLPALLRLKSAYGDAVALEYFGDLPAMWPADFPARRLPYVADYSAYLLQQWQRGWHLGLAPLAQRPFNRYKTNNKFREYGALGIVGLYSRWDPYLSDVREGETGFWVDAPDHWGGVLEQAMAVIQQPGLWEAMRQAAFEAVLGRYALHAVWPQWAQALCLP
jgi:hypothetical protein